MVVRALRPDVHAVQMRRGWASAGEAMGELSGTRRDVENREFLQCLIDSRRVLANGRDRGLAVLRIGQAAERDVGAISMRRRQVFS